MMPPPSMKENGHQADHLTSLTIAVSLGSHRIPWVMIPQRLLSACCTL